jgi:hypothetical protein
MVEIIDRQPFFLSLELFSATVRKNCLTERDLSFVALNGKHLFFGEIKHWKL